MTNQHLAQLNIAQPKFDLEDDRMAGFTGNLDKINAIAERSPGFVWRLTGDGDDATDVSHPDAPDSIVNLSVWESAEALENFVWNTAHKAVYRSKAKWFGQLGTPHFVMWHVPENHLPGLDEAFGRLRHLTEHGSSDHAFGWDGLPNLRRWLQEQCA